MTLGETTTLHCDGCAAILTTKWSLRGGPTGSRRWSTRKRYGWKQINPTSTKRRDYCAECVKAGLAK